MRRHDLRLSGATILATLVLSACSAAYSAHEVVIDNPYEDVDWESTTYVHSMSHYHSGRPPEQRQEAYDMGLRHLAFTNYYPAAPLYPPDPAWVRQFPGRHIQPQLGTGVLHGFGCSRQCAR